MTDRHDVDDFGIPDSFFGTQPEEFYGALGRIAVLSSLLEHHVRLLAKKLDPRGGKKVSMATVLAGARAGLFHIGDETERQFVDEFLDDVGTSALERNFYLHSIWPAQSSGVLFGWKGQPWPETKETNGAVIRQDIAALVELNERWLRLWPWVSRLPDLEVEDNS